MIYKSLIDILVNYRFSIIKIILFELFYLIGGYKGNKITFSKNQQMTNNIPCPYYFLHKIKNAIKKYDFNIFIDLGCGSGRPINYFNKNFKNKKFIGFEYFEEQFSICKKNFKLDKNINIFKKNFLEFDFLIYKPDCYFFNDPIKNNNIFSNLIKKIINSSITKQNTLLIFVNCDNKILKSFKKIQCIENYQINDSRGFSIYCVNNK